MGARLARSKSGAFPLLRDTISHYSATGKLGAGGMGEVYRATDEQLDRDVAIKVLPASSFSDPAAQARVLREASLARRISCRAV